MSGTTTRRIDMSSPLRRHKQLSTEERESLYRDCEPRPEGNIAHARARVIDPNEAMRHCRVSCFRTSSSTLDHSRSEFCRMNKR